MLVRYDPFDDRDRFLGEVMIGVDGPPPRRAPMDAVRRGDRVEMSCELLGVDPGSIEVTVDDVVLAFRAHCPAEVTRRRRAPRARAPPRHARP